MKHMSGIAACHNNKFNNVFKIYDIKIVSLIMPEELDMFKLQQQTKKSFPTRNGNRDNPVFL
jgi:hypothetical protein